MDSRVKSQLLGAVAVFVFAALFLPALFGGKDDSWGGWVYEYQTLITGFLAVAAAMATVVQMRSSERSSLILSLRPEARRLERLLNPDWRRLKHLNDFVRRTKIPRNFEDGTPEQNWERYREEVLSARNVFGTISRTLRGKEWENIGDLVSRDTEERIENVSEIAEWARYLCAEELKRLGGKTVDLWKEPRLTNDDEPQRSIFVDAVEESADELINDMDALLNDLLVLAESVFANVHRSK